MGSMKNALMGFLHAGIAAASYIIVPYFGFNAIKSLAIPGFGAINYGKSQEDAFLFYTIAMGIIIVAIAFGRGSSPKLSRRRAAFALLQVFSGALFTFVIRYTGLGTVPVDILNSGGDKIAELTVSFDLFIFMIFGIVAINIILNAMDFIICWIDQAKERVYSLDKYYSAKKSTRIEEQARVRAERIEKERREGIS